MTISKFKLTNQRAGGGGAVFDSYTMDGRLTLQSGVPVPTTDQSAKSTLYLAPYKGGQIALHNGAAWSVIALSEISLDISGMAADKPYDVFCYNNAGTPALEILVWTNATTRATALTTQNGILVKTGDTTRRYIGTIYSNSAGGQTDDTLLRRCVWNYYNREKRVFEINEATATWTYATDAWRAANNSVANRCNFVVGFSESPVHLNYKCLAVHSLTGANVIGIGLDITNGNSANNSGYCSGGSVQTLSVVYNKIVAVGFHFLQLVERTSGATTTYFGSVNAFGGLSGATGHIEG